MQSWLSFIRRHIRATFAVAGGVLLLVIAAFYLQNDLHRGALDPKVPFQVYQPPKAPDYAAPEAWYLNPALPGYYAAPQKADVFFVHGTTYNGGEHWLAPLDDRAAVDQVVQIHLPNYAAPFSIYGNVYAPRYRQANLFTQLTGRDDAREAIEYAYRDVEAAFRAFLKNRRGGRGFVVVGVEQGAVHAQKLMKVVIANDAQLNSEMIAAYLIENLAVDNGPDGIGTSFAACSGRNQTGCIVAYVTVDSPDTEKAVRVLRRSVYWKPDGRLDAVSGKPTLCVNPLTGSSEGEGTKRQSEGAVNATGLEWGVQPPLIAHRVSAQCVAGFLVVHTPPLPSFTSPVTWEDKRKVAPYNLFYGDLKADFEARLKVFRAATSPAERSS